ncbi:hypothetical protein [Streptomyces sp. NPDC052225]|uniref:hypothetical protein n=1 Tax=Streptomyces sp. NPDC052225 TaxID=3154949 RepID=UPI00343EA08D
MRATAWLAFAVAVTLNLVEATADPSGVLWGAARVAASVVFTVAMIANVAMRLSRERP